MKRKLTMITVIAGLAVFSLVSVAAVSAGGFGGSSERQERVAELLGITTEELQSAQAQARSEAMAERLAEKLAEAVEAEVLTQDEADAISDWFAGKPDALSNLSRSEHRGLRTAVKEDGLSDFLAGLVTEEVISQAESDEISGWFDVQPTETLEKFHSEFGHGHGGRGGRGHRGFGRHGGGFPRFGAPEAAPSTDTATAIGSAI
jgi:hypothetical protein